MSSGAGAGAGVTFLGTGAEVKKSDCDHLCSLGYNVKNRRSLEQVCQTSLERKSQTMS